VSSVVAEGRPEVRSDSNPERLRAYRMPLRDVVIACRSTARLSNYLFAGSDADAERAAVAHAVLATCTLHELDPWAYVTDVLDKIAAGRSGRSTGWCPTTGRRSTPRRCAAHARPAPSRAPRPPLAHPADEAVAALGWAAQLSGRLL
jgi:hypothetical protein